MEASGSVASLSSSLLRGSLLYILVLCPVSVPSTILVKSATKFLNKVAVIKMCSITCMCLESIENSNSDLATFFSETCPMLIWLLLRPARGRPVLLLELLCSLLVQYFLVVQCFSYSFHPNALRWSRGQCKISSTLESFAVHHILTWWYLVYHGDVVIIYHNNVTSDLKQ